MSYRPAGTRRTIDVAFTRQKVAVFLDGCFWHGCPDHYRPAHKNAEFWSAKIAANRARDADTSARLQAAGWVVLRYWEHQSSTWIADEVERVVREGVRPFAGWFTLDAFEAEAAEGGPVAPRWPAVTFGDPWNGWATPVVTPEVLVSVLDVVAAATGEAHRWDGDVAVVAGPVSESGEPEYEDRLEPDDSGLYDLGELGWTWVELA